MSYDLVIIGGGINGVGIARDAAGRGLRVLLVEKGDLAGATSSASSKLVHGGLRYLEYREFRLVREALKEREVLLGIAPHIIWPMEFLLPLLPGMRPRWMIRLGLFLYDHLAPRRTIRRSSAVTLRGDVLKDWFFRAFRYTDCWVDDARLVIANAQSARELGADIRTRTACTGLQREGTGWRVTLDTVEQVTAKAIVNAAGAWVEQIAGFAGDRPSSRLRLVKGSHIVVPRIHRGTHAYILQLPDKRVLFILPFQDRFSLIGTTDTPFKGDASKVAISAEETDYLLHAVNIYLEKELTAQDIVWTYAGVRALYDDASDNPSAITRDYVLELETDAEGTAPILNLFGGKITTYRRLAESAMDKLLPFFPAAPRASWTGTQLLPGGAPYDPGILEGIDPALAARWKRQYGSRIAEMLRDGLGEQVADGVYACELRYSRAQEWTMTAEDFLWRRTKLGLTLSPDAQAHVAAWLQKPVD